MLIGGSGFWLIDIGSLDVLPVWVLKFEMIASCTVLELSEKMK